MHHPLYRSEAFAEDLLDDATPNAPRRAWPHWLLPLTVLLIGLAIGWVR